MSEPIGYCHLQYNEDGSFFADSFAHSQDSYTSVPVYLQKVEDVNWEAIAADQALTTVFDVQLMEDALEALESCESNMDGIDQRYDEHKVAAAIAALKERLKKV
jgi:hypothetical protein